MDEVVEFTESDVRLANSVARQRDRDGRRANANRNKYGKFDGTTFDVHLIGCMGELGFAKAARMTWSGATDSYHEDTDVGGYQVRATKRTGGSLIVRPNEGDNKSIWVLVTLSEANCRVVGWTTGELAKHDRYLRSPNGRPPAFFIPQQDLQSPQSLPGLTHIDEFEEIDPAEPDDCPSCQIYSKFSGKMIPIQCDIQAADGTWHCSKCVPEMMRFF